MANNENLIRHFEAVGDQYRTETPPEFQMIVNGAEEWLPIRRAGITYDCGWVPVSIGGLVKEDGEFRPITAEERIKIADIADDWSASK